MLQLRVFRSSLKTIRLSSTIIKSPFEMPELSSSAIETSSAKFSMENFLNADNASRMAIMDGFSGKSLTYSKLHERTTIFAEALRKHGIKKGDVVALISPNDLHYFEVFHGIGLAGATSTPINPIYTEHEIDYQCEATNAKIIVTHAMCYDKVKNVAAKRNMKVIMLGASAGEVQGIDDFTSGVNVSSIDYDSFTCNPDDIATLPFSSGTTGRSKGVMLTHRNLNANVLQCYPAEGKFFKRDQPVLVPLPLFHIFGLLVGLCLPARYGVGTILMPQFDLVKFLELIAKHKVSRGYVVPPIVLALAKHPIVDNYDLSSLDSLMSGAAPLGLEVQEACAKRLKCVVKQAWGMTELSPAGSITPDDLALTPAAMGKSGLLVPGTEAKIVHSVTGEDLSPYEEGELLLRGPNVMKGYHNNPEATAATIRPDGFMHTGDIAKFDKDGWLQITDRSKELIKYKGYQVPPAELEAVINSMPQVKDVVVIPVPCEETGEIPRAYVVKQDNVTISEKDVLDFVRERVAPYKQLRGGVIFTHQVPRSASGKLLRRVQIEMDRKNKGTAM